MANTNSFKEQIMKRKIDKASRELDIYEHLVYRWQINRSFESFQDH